MKIAVFASGHGSNLEQIHRAIVSGELSNIEISFVLSNNSQSGALEFARRNQIEACHISHRQFEGDEQRWASAMENVLHIHAVEMIALAGYMKKLPNEIIERYRHRILNVHPALLPSFGGTNMYGMRVHEAVLARGCKVSGATVHFVNEIYDEGPIILQESCLVQEDDTPQSLKERVQPIEHKLFVRALRLLSENKIELRNNIAYTKP